MRNFKGIIEYDGTKYHGFQKQLGQGVPTIQGTLESCLMRVLKEPIKVQGAGRTDAGAHAFGQVINFTANCEIPLKKIPQAINSRLPMDIVVKEVQEVELDFHAQYHSVGKHYSYRIYNSRTPSVFHQRYAYFIPVALDENLFREGCKALIGTHNFKGFSSKGGSVKTYVRNVYCIELMCQGPHWEIHVKGNGFLYKMVRTIVGTLLEIAKGTRTIDSIYEILETQNRRLAGKTAPANGLFLEKVYYNL